MRFTAKKSLRTLIHYRSCERAYGVRRGNRSCDLDQDPKRNLVASPRRKRSSRILLAVVQHLEVSIGGSSRSVHLECISLRRTTTPALRCDRRGIDSLGTSRAGKRSPADAVSARFFLHTSHGMRQESRPPQNRSLFFIYTATSCSSHITGSIFLASFVAQSRERYCYGFQIRGYFRSSGILWMFNARSLLQKEWVKMKSEYGLQGKHL